MFDIDRWVEIWVTITRNKTRSLLTCFGVFWGILMLVILLGAGNGMKNAMFSNINGFATNSAFFFSDRTSESYKGFNKGRQWDMRNRDVESIRKQVKDIEAVSPIIWGNRSDKNIVFGQLSGTYNVKGVQPDYFKIETQQLYYGRLLNEIDEIEKRKVCLIGAKVNEVLFKGNDPCGKYIRVNGIYYQVVGVTKQRASSVNIGGRAEESVFLPFSTMQQTLNQGGTYNVKGVQPDYFKIETQQLYYGRLLNEIDEIEKRKVCLIGAKVNEVLFKGNDPCGKYIRVNGIYYQVVGVTKQRASSVNIGGRAEESVFLPFSTMQQTLNQGDIIHFLCVSAKPGYKIDPVITQIKDIVKSQNQISPTDPQAVTVINLAAQFETFNMLFIGIDILIWLVGMGTLLAGIIGVSNIMMVTVKERTREIGVRRALGAKPWNIISQIMSESLLLTALAGLLGLSAGVFLLDLVDKIMSAQPASNGTMMEHPEVSIQIAVAATVILLFSGLLAGLIPAWRAMQIKAIDAIREE